MRGRAQVALPRKLAGGRGRILGKWFFSRETNQGTEPSMPELEGTVQPGIPKTVTGICDSFSALKREAEAGSWSLGTA